MKNGRLLNILFLFFIFIPVIKYFQPVNELSLNLPFQDDYEAILDFLNKFKEAVWTDKLALLFSQHGEHRILSSRIVYALYYALTGTINFKTLIFLGNLQLIVTLCIILYFSYKWVGKFWFIPGMVFSICLFDLNNFENANWAMAGLQNYGVIMFFLLSMFFYDLKDIKWLIAAVLCQGLCVFSSGNGSIAAVALLLFCIISGDKRKYIASGISLVVFVALYFVHYVRTQNDLASTDIINITTWYLHIAGGHFGLEMAAIAGAIILLTMLICLPLQKKFKPDIRSAAFLSIAFFILGSIGTVSIFRSNDILQHSYSSRYLLYPNLLTAIAFLFLFMKLEKLKPYYKWIATGITAIVLITTYSSNYDYGMANLNLRHNRLTYIPICHPDVEKATNIANKSCKEDIYCIDNER